MESTDPIFYTDGWHPTVNPSSRMITHHFRFIELLSSSRGILNEVPRRRGGCTFRFMRFDKGGFHILALPTPLELVPWWLPASPDNASKFLFHCYEQALLHKGSLTRSEYDIVETILEQLREAARATPDLTIGEVLNQTNETNYRSTIPTLPKLKLISFTRSPLRHVFARAINKLATNSQLEKLLSIWAMRSDSGGFTMLGFGHTDDNKPYRVSWSQGAKTLANIFFDPSTGKDMSGRIKTRPEELADQIARGRLVLGSRLASLLEVFLWSEGSEVLHFGNNYGRIDEAREILNELGYTVPMQQDITLCKDDEDSWHVGVVRSNSQSYPLHLLDIMLSSSGAQALIPSYTLESLRTQSPIYFFPRGDLDETLLNRGS